MTHKEIEKVIEDFGELNNIPYESEVVYYNGKPVCVVNFTKTTAFLQDWFTTTLTTLLENERKRWEERESELVNEVKSLEVAWMSLKDDYSELARALGAPGDAWFGDPLEGHAQVLARAKATQLKTLDT